MSAAEDIEPMALRLGARRLTAELLTLIDKNCQNEVKSARHCLYSNARHQKKRLI